MHHDLHHDLHALLPGRGAASRRHALGLMLGAGYAAAAAPVLAQQAIATPADGLVAGEVSFAVNGAQVYAYRAAPQGRTGLPVVLVVSEIFGVHEHIADVCRRLAQAGTDRGANRAPSYVWWRANSWRSSSAAGGRC